MRPISIHQLSSATKHKEQKAVCMGKEETCIIFDHFRDPVIDPLNDSRIFRIKIRQRNIIISKPTLPLSPSSLEKELSVD